MSATSGLTVLHDAHCAAQFVRHNAAARKPWRVRFSAVQGRYEAQPHKRGWSSRRRQGYGALKQPNTAFAPAEALCVGW